MTEKTVVGLTGEKGSGKSTFVRVLRKELPGTSLAVERFVDILRETLDLWGLPKTRENLQNASIAMDETFGDGTLAAAVKRRVQDRTEDLIVLDGMRWEADLKLVRSFPKNVVVYVTADPKLRYERLKTQGEKEGADEATYEQFLKEEEAKTETAIPKLGAAADVKIENNGAPEEFERRVREVIKEHI